MKIKPHISGQKRCRWENTVRVAASRVDKPMKRSVYNACCLTPTGYNLSDYPNGDVPMQKKVH